MPTSSVIGGVHPLPPEPMPGAAPPTFWNKVVAWAANARSAMHVVAQVRRFNTVWLPSYACEALGRVFPDARRFPVDDALRPHPEGVGRGDLVVLINYFGTPYPAEVGRYVKDCGAYVLEDAAWSWFTPPGPLSDFTVYSPPKSLGVPDGGLLLSREDLDVPPLSEPPADWLHAAHGCRWLRSFSPDRNDAWHALDREAKRLAPLGPYGMTEYSKSLLGAYFDYPTLAARCRENFDFLWERFGHLCPVAPIWPTGFPIRVGDRDGVRRRLAAERIFCPVLWPPDGLLVLPCDHRYGLDDMARIVAESGLL